LKYVLDRILVSNRLQVLSQVALGLYICIYVINKQISSVGKWGKIKNPFF
jgi:hypothetical protein